MDGSSTVIEAVASGREAACEIGRSLGDLSVTGAKSRSACSFTAANYEPSPRLFVEDSPVAERLKNTALEDRPGITASDAETEAGRCFNCGCVAVNPSDIGTALVALDGRIVTTKRNIDAEAFFAPDATSATVLDADEMITEILVPKTAEGTQQHYLKFTLRKPIDFAIVSVASVVGVRNEVCENARIVLGAVAPAPIRSIGAEGVLRGKELTEQLAEEAAAAAVDGSVPLGKNAYKVQIARALVKRAILGEPV
jgi:CO/xanthine dehydrogenase FAD-binding subunit